MLRNYESEKQAKEQYGSCRLCYRVSSDDLTDKSNLANFEKMREALEEVGVWLNLDEKYLFLSIDPERYVLTKERNAGRRKKITWKNNGKYEIYKYSDIVYMMQTMKDQEVADELGMPIATFYRHKKALKDSLYYKSLDLNRLRDKEYLESVSQNYSF